MRFFCSVLLAILLFGCTSSTSPFVTGPVELPDDVNGHPFYADTIDNGRTYLFERPDSVVPGKRYPLVFVFHGAYGNGAGMRYQAGYYESSFKDSVMFVYPDSKVENWEEGCGCNKPWRLGIDDIGFIDNLLTKVKQQHSVDTNRVYAVGFSQGGLFAHHVACRLSNKFAAVASVASSMNVPLSGTCANQEPLSIMIVHGLLDEVLPYNGSNEGAFSLMSATATAAFWAQKLGIHNSLTQLNPRSGLTRTKYGSVEAVSVDLYTPTGGGHSWNFPVFDTSTEVMMFFLGKGKIPIVPE